MTSALFRVGAACSRHPWRVSLLALVCSLVLCLGLQNVRVQSDPQKLWVPPDSVTATEQANFNDLFHPFFRVQQLIFYVDDEADKKHVSKHGDGVEGTCEDDEVKPVDDLIQKKYLLKMAELETAIREEVMNTPAGKLSLEDFCYRPIKGKGCLVTSPFQYWLGNRTLLEGDPDIKLTTACQTTDPTLKERSPCMDQNGVPVMRNVVFGGLSKDSCHENPDPCGETTPKAKALMVTFLLRNDLTNATYMQYVEMWEDQVFVNLASRFNAQILGDPVPYDGMKLAYMAQRSVADSLEVQTKQNAFIVFISYLVMFLYVSMSLGKFYHPIHSRFGLGFTGILIVLLSLGISMGVCSALFQMEVTMITLEVVPFLILAIGVDNMFILTNEFDRLLALRGLSSSMTSGTSVSGSRRRLEENEMLDQVLGETMANVGPSILVAAISECLAFLVGALTRIPALETFCIVAAVAVLADFVLQVTWFTSALVLDARRVRGRRYDLFPWLRQGIVLVPQKDESHGRRPSATEAWPYAGTNGGGLIKTFVERTYSPFVMRKSTKLIVLVTSLAFVLLSIVGSRDIPLGLEQELAVPTDFYLHEYFRVQTKYGEAGPPAYLVIGDGVDYTNGKTQTQLNQLIDELSGIRQYIQLPIYSWLHTFNQWRQMRYFLQEKIDDELCDCPVQPLDPFPYEVVNASHHSVFEPFFDGHITPNELFYPVVKNFSEISIDSQCCQQFGLCGAQYEGDLVFKTDEQGKINGIRGSRMRFQMNAMKNQTMFVNSYYYSHEITRKWSSRLGQVFPYTLYFVFYEQYSYIQGVALQSILLALLVVFGSIFLLMERNFRLSLIVTVCVLSMTLSLMGFIFVWNHSSTTATSINAVSVVNLLACVGLGVEFCIHMTHQFDFSRKNRLGITGNDHTKHAMSSVGASIISGITLTKFCGIGVLAFAPSMLFRVYFFRMYMGIVLLGFFHGMLLLPVLLSLFGQKAEYPNDFSTFLLSEEQEDTDEEANYSAY
ncbi:hypothetical protein Poli38472_009224 [Pythium oligandrum]|uniref:SSD domain-containing protein n=1 Tax=Pythium oligandrum TaxID=41045 RepID=A0A8K1FMN7_PYTOL|nr:hypothetical protein Poli38472_009224 [Pythium oligandrum]|eukprot:TMW65057.1 hypothetical protein Poli38472_009224 [Pythium oligandrum]